MSFVGDFINYAVVMYINYKSEAFEKFQKFITDIRTKFKNKKKFSTFCVHSKFRHEFTVPETSEQNGVAERHYQTIVEKAKFLLIQANLSKTYWVKAIETANHIRNIVKKTDDKTLAFQMILNRHLNQKNLRICGCSA